MILMLATSACGLHRPEPINQPAKAEDKQQCNTKAKNRWNAAIARHKNNERLGTSFGLLGGLIAQATDPAPDDRDYHMNIPELYQDCMMQRGYKF